MRVGTKTSSFCWPISVAFSKKFIRQTYRQIDNSLYRTSTGTR